MTDTARPHRVDNLILSSVSAACLALLALLATPVHLAAQTQEGEQPAAPSETASAAPAESPAAADQTPPCASPEHRQFDFWLGSWEVRRPDGALAGTNRIELLYDGCALRESWKGTSGSVGTSLNLYDAARGVWHQTWVDGQGGLLLLEGGIDGGAMVMRGHRPSQQDPAVEVLHEIRWEPLEDGRVRQLWRASKDDGETWQTLFDGLYSPAS